MKIIASRVNAKTVERKTLKSFNYESFLFLLFFTSFALLILAQAVLASQVPGEAPLEVKHFNGVPLKSDEYLFEEGEVLLILKEGNTDGSAGVMINGELAGFFTEEELTLKVKEGDLLELYAAEDSGDVEAELIPLSQNIDPSCCNRRLKIRRGMGVLTRIKLIAGD